ncbi:hypothetical protein GFY24_18950 [Nocardia sp. SYP-A9097]|uniref:hypothetical protein n=1 Tax=Nocardia sp. SYP-A9097 TaxID=2663237 RepID=UPI00129A73F8|nr:hypothetical protein [Nocardia sp. SYP-A9097]MRH89499.1 hypothetical protein [Nocardia sp. SYP-A9097]
MSPPTRRLLKRRLELDLHGELATASLDQLRRNLGLTAVDTLGETPNTVLGERIERSLRYRSIVEMAMTFSHLGAQEWSLTIDAVPRTDIDRWQCLAEIACRVAGLRIVASHTPEPFVLDDHERQEIREEAARLVAQSQRGLDEILLSTPFKAFEADSKE